MTAAGCSSGAVVRSAFIIFKKLNKIITCTCTVRIPQVNGNCNLAAHAPPKTTTHKTARSTAPLLWLVYVHQRSRSDTQHSHRHVRPLELTMRLLCLCVLLLAVLPSSCRGQTENDGSGGSGDEIGGTNGRFRNPMYTCSCSPTRVHAQSHLSHVFAAVRCLSLINNVYEGASHIA